MKRYSFYVSGGAGRLKQFIELPFFASYRNQIVFVLSDNPADTELAVLCKTLSLPLYYFDHATIEIQQRGIQLSDCLCNLLDEYQVDYGFVFGSRILQGQLLEKYAGRLINFHPSVLPSFKGRKSIDKAIEEKSFLLGNSAHFIVKDVDSGPVIMQYLSHNSTIESIELLLNKQVIMLSQLILWFNEDRIVISNGYALVLNACYKVNEFIPNLEPNVSSQLVNL